MSKALKHLLESRAMTRQQYKERASHERKRRRIRGTPATGMIIYPECDPAIVPNTIVETYYLRDMPY